MITQYIRTPFANSGDKEDIPQDVQTTGSISWPEGWGADYEKDLETDASAKPIDRLDMNELFNVLTVGLKFLQENVAPEWITAAGNGGVAFQYQTGQSVTYLDSDGNRSLWTSIVDNNTTTPGTDSTKWQPYVYRSANSSEVIAETGNYPVLPQHVAQIIEANREALPEATTSVKGIVQLSNSLRGSSSTLAASEKAVGQKLSQLGALSATNLDSLNYSAASGIYFQSSDANATTANGYPSGAAAGTLLVYGNTNGWPAQMYIAHSLGTIWTRMRLNGESGWSGWVVTTPTIPYATSQDAGVVRIGAEFNSTGSSRAFTEGGAAYKATYDRDGLGTTNLNDISNPQTQAGVYYQIADANATTERNYPENRAGTLFAFGSLNGALFQIYTCYSGNSYTRAYDGTGAAWAAWQQVNRTQAAGQLAVFAIPATSQPPAGYLACNGAAVSRTQFSALFATIGTRYGVGDGSTTFNLPNITANYSLVANNGSAGVGLSTNGSIGYHAHTAYTSAAGDHAHDISGTTTSAGDHAHSVTAYNTGGVVGNTGYGANSGAYRNPSSFNTNNAGVHSHSISGSTTVAGSHQHYVTVDPTGSAQNIAAGFYGQFCISY